MLDLEQESGNNKCSVSICIHIFGRYSGLGKWNIFKDHRLFDIFYVLENGSINEVEKKTITYFYNSILECWGGGGHPQMFKQYFSSPQLSHVTKLP